MKDMLLTRKREIDRNCLENEDVIIFTSTEALTMNVTTPLNSNERESDAEVKMS